jgi:hypothetical protein
VKNPLLIGLLLCSLGTLALAAFKLLNKQWFSGVYLVVIGLLAIVMVAAFVRSLNRPDVALEAADSAGGRIVMRGADPDGMLIYAICFFVFSVALVQYPDLLWTRWLSYPAALVALAVVGVMLWATLGGRLERVVADSSGVRVLNVRVPEPITEVAWADVGAVNRKTRIIGGVTHRPGTGTTRHEFVLLDRKGEELLKIDDPLEPPDRYRRFLESIPRWTGLQVQDTLETK